MSCRPGVGATFASDLGTVSYTGAQHYFLILAASLKICKVIIYNILTNERLQMPLLYRKKNGKKFDCFHSRKTQFVYFNTMCLAIGALYIDLVKSCFNSLLFLFAEINVADLHAISL